MNALIKTEDWATLAEAVRATGITPAMIRRLVEQGRIKTWTIPGVGREGTGRRRYSVADLAALVPQSDSEAAAKQSGATE